jgi:hypothetical protein
VVFGLPESDVLVMTKKRAKQRYLLRDSDFAKLRPFYDVHEQTAGTTGHAEVSLVKYCGRAWNHCRCD